MFRFNTFRKTTSFLKTRRLFNTKKSKTLDEMINSIKSPFLRDIIMLSPFLLLGGIAWSYNEYYYNKLKKENEIKIKEDKILKEILETEKQKIKKKIDQNLKEKDYKAFYSNLKDYNKDGYFLDIRPILKKAKDADSNDYIQLVNYLFESNKYDEIFYENLGDKDIIERMIKEDEIMNKVDIDYAILSAFKLNKPKVFTMLKNKKYEIENEIIRLQKERHELENKIKEFNDSVKPYEDIEKEKEKLRLVSQKLAIEKLKLRQKEQIYDNINIEEILGK